MLRKIYHSRYYCENRRFSAPIYRHRKMLNFETKNPEEIIQIVANNFIHIKNPDFIEAFKNEYNNDVFNESDLPSIRGIYRWVDTGHGTIITRGGKKYAFNRPIGFVGRELAVLEKVPYSCHGIAALASAALVENGIPNRCRAIATKVPFEDKYVHHWVVEYWNGQEWVIKDPSFPERDCKAHSDHLLAWHVYDLSKYDNGVKKEFRITMKGVPLSSPGAIAMKFMIRDILTLAGGPFNPSGYNEYFDNKDLGDKSNEALSSFYEKYGEELRNSLYEPEPRNKLERPDINRLRELTEKYEIKIKVKIKRRQDKF